MASPNFRDNFEQKRGRLCRIFECRDHACGALADDDGGAAADDVDAVFALPHVIVARVGRIAHEGALAPLPHRSIFRRIAAAHAAVSSLRGPADRSPAQCGVRPHRGSVPDKGWPRPVAAAWRAAILAAQLWLITAFPTSTNAGKSLRACAPGRSRPCTARVPPLPSRSTADTPAAPRPSACAFVQLTFRRSR